MDPRSIAQEQLGFKCPRSNKLMGAIIPSNFGISRCDPGAPRGNVPHILRPRLLANVEVLGRNLDIHK